MRRKGGTGNVLVETSYREKIEREKKVIKTQKNQDSEEV